MTRGLRRATVAVLAITVLAALTLGCGDWELSFGGDDEGAQAVKNLTDSYAKENQEKPVPRDSRLAEGEIYRVHLTFGEAMADGGWYSVEIKNPRNNWRDFVRWDCASISDFEEEYRFYDFPFSSGNFNSQDPAQMDGEYDLVISNGFGYEKLVKLTWSDGQFIDGGYTEYAVP